MVELVEQSAANPSALYVGASTLNQGTAHERLETERTEHHKLCAYNHNHFLLGTTNLLCGLHYSVSLFLKMQIYS